MKVEVSYHESHAQSINAAAPVQSRKCRALNHVACCSLTILGMALISTKVLQPSGMGMRLIDEMLYQEKKGHLK